MDEFEVVFYRRKDGSRPMDAFLGSLDRKLRAKAVRDLKELRVNASMLCEPHSKAMSKGLFELRIRQGGNIARAFYFFFDGHRIIVTNGFVKKSHKTPRRELERALRFKADWEERHRHG
ncbi:type II toxin-antitoxin system RelE/ParE family toxin [Eggerthella sp. YY7918]|uniref:type II toxin-antitoxin system RelE/ParE family toxin n=1 Tax=Eggerthella sp. (strain YY7918) TaxID=502558 RepID=UPI000217134F|nr:type II toxin-antitoxin system RelE/ParE family toxin [Eggerthella sp. YY7918]BAK44247.1 hypothetical protein EGYY_10690 [Eggerthella sp. YY7918]